MKRNFWGFFLFLISGSSYLYSDTPNNRVFPSANIQLCTYIAAHPLNPNFMAGTANTDVYQGGYTTGAYITSDGGTTWNGTNAIRTAQNNIISTVGDASVTIDKNGVIIISYIAPPPVSGQKNFRLGVSRSTNSGASWTPTYFVQGVDTADKILCATDDISSSPYYGRSYIVYSEKRGVFMSYTTNSGETWSVSARVSPPQNHGRVGASIVTGNAGEVFVTWPYIYGSVKYIGFAKSLDGGNTWINNDFAIPVIPSPFDFRFNFNLVKLNGLPALAIDKSGGVNNGKLYIVCTQGLSTQSPSLDDYDVVLYTSVNSGSTWSNASLVHQSISGITRHQFFPNICVDKNGGVNISYYDNRNTPTNDSSEIYISRSEDGGNTFQDILMSDHKFKLSQLSSSDRFFANPPYIGTYFGITSAGGKVHTFWFDNSTGKYQAWHSFIETAPEVLVKIIPQGLYTPVSDKLGKKDSVKIFLRSYTPPYQKLDSSVSILDSNSFTGKFIFENIANGQYYIEVVHKNSVITWSSNPVYYNTLTGFNYDFSDAQGKAYGQNQIQINNNPVRYAIYTGDVNRDGSVDLPDLQMVEEDLVNFQTGNFITDINGDNIVDNADLTFVENNSVNFVYLLTP